MQPDPLPSNLIWAPLVQTMNTAQSNLGIVCWKDTKTLLPEVKQMLVENFRTNSERFRHEAEYFLNRHPPMEDIGFVKALLIADSIRSTNGHLTATDYTKLRTNEAGWQEAVSLLKSSP